jgi:Ca2+-binding RTX toxin-like protein
MSRSFHQSPAAALRRAHRRLALRAAALSAVTCVVAAGLLTATAPANTSHAGWPTVNGVLLINKLNDDRPIDMRPGEDPFDGQDPNYSCDELHSRRTCFPGTGPVVVSSALVHNELLGGNGSDTIHAGPAGDIIWGDYEPGDQSTTQVDHLYGGPGNDFIYASHGINDIDSGGGADQIHAHFGSGVIRCESPAATVFLSHESRPHYKLIGCTNISYATVGY